VRVVLLAGGTGGAKLARGLSRVLQDERLSVIVNTADDDTFYGLHVSPDVDAVLYRLSGRFNEQTGFGVAGDTFTALRMLRDLGEDVWFQLGDADIGLQLIRKRLLQQGATLSDVAAHCARALGVAAAVIPMSDDAVRTRLTTESGESSLQEWFVRDGCRPRVLSIRFHGAEDARPSSRALEAIARSDAVIVGPSNPFISIDPILAVTAGSIRERGVRVVGVSPLVGDVALKGPTARLFGDLGQEPTAAAVALHYGGLLTDLVVHSGDAADTSMISGMRVHQRDILMPDDLAEEQLARGLLTLLTT
jgi:LPPG:FO 2-phospho-L-lactate transferase